MAAQLAMTKVLNDYDNSPFHKDSMDLFLDSRKKEVETLQDIFDRQAENGRDISVDFDNSGEGNICLLRHTFTVRFQLKVLPLNLEKSIADQYIDTEPGKWSEHQKWFNSPTEVSKVGSVYTSFLNFADNNKGREDICFSVNLLPLDGEDSSAEVKPAELDVRNSYGVPIYTDFTPPGLVKIKRVTRGWKSLKIDVQFRANPHVHQLETAYEDLSALGPEIIESLDLTPSQTQATILLEDLQMNHLYQVKFTLVTTIDNRGELVVLGKGPTSRPKSLLTLPSRPPANFRVSEKTHHGIKLHWNKPLEVGPNVKVIGYQYRYYSHVTRKK